MMKRKITTFLLVLVLVFTATACSKEQPAPSAATKKIAAAVFPQ